MALIDLDIPVLCEKSLAVDVAEAEQMVDRANGRGVFLMEAMWTRFMPFWDQITDLIGSGAIGELRTVTAHLDIVANPDPTRRWFDPDQGGGALLDTGIYPITLAHGFAGPPRSISSEAVIGETGVEVQNAVVMVHDNDVMSLCSTSIVSDRRVTATLSGSTGRIDIAQPFHHPPSFTVHRADAEPEFVDTSFEGSGYRFEVDEVHRCLREGLTESPRRPLSDTLEVMQIMETARSQWSR
jgi:predicted dehydrogenase